MPRPKDPVRRPSLPLFAVLLALIAAAGPRQASAQVFSFDGREMSLREALRVFADASGWDVVYADRLVADHRTTCRYVGASPTEALACLLRGTGLEARIATDRQVVLVPAGRAVRTRGTLAGYVLDRGSGEVLPGAHVYLPDLRRGAVTSRAGYFAFPDLPAGSHRVQVSFIGFAPIDTLLGTAGAPVILTMGSGMIETRAVVIESSGTGRADLGLVPGLVAIPVQRLQQLPASLGGQDLLEALKWMPGVARAGEVTGGLVVRGAGSDQNLYLVDGAPVYHPWHAFSLVSSFQTETFRQIRLYRGAFPAEYGGRLSAVLDAELSDGRRTEPRAVASVGALSARFLIESPITTQSSFMLSGRRSYIDRIIGRTHPVEDDAGRRDTLRTGYHFYDWSAKVVYRPDKDARISASYYTGGDRLDLRLPFDISLDRNSWLRPSDLLFEIDEAWRNTLFSVRFERLLAEEWYLTATTYDARYTAHEGAFVQPTLTAAVRSRYDVSIRDLGASVDIDHYRSLRHQLRGGVRIVRRRFDSSVDATIGYAPGVSEGMAQESGMDDVELSTFGQSVWHPVRPLHVVSGLRADYFADGNHARLAPRLSVQYAIDPALLVLQAAFSRNHQFLHRVRDRFSFLYDLVSSRWVPSGEEVRPAGGTQLSLGLESRPAEGLELRAGTYVRRSSGLLLPRDEFRTKDGLPGPGIELGTLLSQYVTGNERGTGAEFDVTVDRGPWLVMVSYTASRTQNRSVSLPDPGWRPARFDVPHALDAFVRWRGSRWSAGASATWRSGYPVTVPVARYDVWDPSTGTTSSYLHRPTINNGRLPAYFRTDVDVSWGFAGLGAAWSLRIQLYNVLARRNVIDRTYEPTDDGVSVRNRLGLPLIPLFEIRMEL
jgi:hypothetical protein